jgi:myo-inositol-1(or 4)-monophosphatase
MVASGIYDGYWEGTLKPWDTAAGSLIAEEAGACVTNYMGQPYDVRMPDVIACNPILQKQVLDLIKAP